MENDNVEFDEWRENWISPDGIVYPNLLFLRCRYKNAEYLCPVSDESDSNIEDTKWLLEVSCRRDYTK